jgi:hypothetical protein
MDVDEPYSQPSQASLPDTTRQKVVMWSYVVCLKICNILMKLILTECSLFLGQLRTT